MLVVRDCISSEERASGVWRSIQTNSMLEAIMQATTDAIPSSGQIDKYLTRSGWLYVVIGPIFMIFTG